MTEVNCPICGQPAAAELLARVDHVDWKILGRLRAAHPEWNPAQGLCPVCVQDALDAFRCAGHDLHEIIYRAEMTATDPGTLVEPAALPIPLRLQANPRYTGQGVCIAFLDAGFYPHPDLTTPVNRIRAVVDASVDPPDERADLEGNPALHHAHGLMTSTVAAGNGALSEGRYRGLASDATVVLVRVADADGHITEPAIQRALEWVVANRERYGIDLVNISLSGDVEQCTWDCPLDRLADAAVAAGLLVVAAAGNDPQAPILPPASAPQVLTVGGVNDYNHPDPEKLELWHSTTGPTVTGHIKPEILAASIWLAAPIPPGTPEAARADHLCELIRRPDEEIVAAVAALDFAPRDDDGAAPLAPAAIRGAVTEHMAEQGWVSAYYKYVDGTSFAAPIVTSVAAQMRQANPALDGPTLRALLISSAELVPGVPVTRQGAGVLRAARAVAAALRAPGGLLPAYLPISPTVEGAQIVFVYYDPAAESVALTAEFNAWRPETARFTQEAPGVWCYRTAPLLPGRHRYKFLVNGTAWIADPENSLQEPDGYGGVNSVVVLG